MLVAVLYNLEEYNRTFDKLVFIISLAVLYTLIVLHVSYGFYCIPAFLHFIFGNSVRVGVFLFYNVCNAYNISVYYVIKIFFYMFNIGKSYVFARVM